MVALADLIEFGSSRRGGSRPRRISLSRRNRRRPAELLELSSRGFSALATRGPSVGERITIELPALGRLEARVTSATRHEFHAEFCGATDLRLLFVRKSLLGFSSWFERRDD